MAVVCLGASAGGLAACRLFFDKMPSDSGMAFVVVQHLDPVHKSEMASLLGRCTRMPVVEASKGLAVEPNHVYVIPPNTALAISQGRLWLSTPTEIRGRQLPINFFLRSLAEEYQHRAIGIVLSGTGGDGTLGLAAVKAAGGMTLAQNPQTAEHDGMPRSAIASGCVDHVLSVEQMPPVLIKYARHPYVRSPDGSSPLDKTPEAPFLAILSLLCTRAKFDFRNYKQGTLRRRMFRRMSLRHITRLEDYLELLQNDSNEVQALISDSLISVTHFFRDPEAWKVLQAEAIRQLVAQKTGDEPIRAWVAGRATGEEAYSVAMVLLDELSAAGKECGVQVFASDVNRETIATARFGVYAESLAADVAPQRQRRYFVREGDHFRVRAELRDAVVFAEHNLLVNPPFPKVDLITCRNLLIYLDSDAQKKILTLFHYSLRPGGCLFLGSAETMGEQPDLFRSVSRKWRIYRRIGPSRWEQLSIPCGATQELVSVAAGVTPSPSRPRVTEVAQQLILDRYAPACVVINHKHEILYTCGPTQNYLTQPAGAM
ncbi:MAG: chemotaxis protein CheB [Tepidisphaeraceae bacterium]